jgi:hypothetical protein
LRSAVLLPFPGPNGRFFALKGLALLFCIRSPGPNGRFFALKGLALLFCIRSPGPKGRFFALKGLAPAVLHPLPCPVLAREKRKSATAL